MSTTGFGHVGNMAMSADIVRVKSVCYFPPPRDLNGRCSNIKLPDFSFEIHSINFGSVLKQRLLHNDLHCVSVMQYLTPWRYFKTYENE